MAGHLYLQKRFSSPQARKKLLMTLWSRGVEDCMFVYGIKSREQFARFIAKMVRQGEFKPMSPLAGISGGEKFKMLVEHQDMIMGCEALLGEHVTRCIFNLSDVTLESLKTRTPGRRYTVPTDRTELEKKIINIEARLEALSESNRENLKAIKELERLFNEFVETTSSQISKALITPLLRSLIHFEGDLQNIDPLLLDALIPDSYKQKKRRKAFKENPLLETIEKVMRK